MSITAHALLFAVLVGLAAAGLTVAVRDVVAVLARVIQQPWIVYLRDNHPVACDNCMSAWMPAAVLLSAAVARVANLPSGWWLAAAGLAGIGVARTVLRAFAPPPRTPPLFATPTRRTDVDEDGLA